MNETYIIIKLVHVLSSTVLLGTGAGIAFFCWFGSRSAITRGDMGALRVVLRFTVLADAIFTAPAVVVQLGSGLWLTGLAGWRLTSPWTVTVLGLFAFVGVCWLPVVWMQVELGRLAAAAESMADLPARFHRLFRAWFLLGIPAFTSVLAIFYLMVAKPLAVT